MSFKFYSKLWISTKQDLENVLQQEHTIETLKPSPDRLFAHRVFASLFPRYIVLCNNLSDIYDQTLQVQKRQVVGKLLETATRRLQELYKQLCDIEMSEIIYVDRTLIENKLTPQDITILKPFYFPMQRTTEIQNLIDDIKPPSQDDINTQPLTGLDKFRVKLTPEQIEAQRKHQILVDAVNLIKSHEKARQARIWKHNIDRDPVTYKPRARPITENIEYQFYYKPDTVMLFPIKRTTYASNFYQELISFSNFKFYKKPVFKEEDKPQFGRRVRKKSKKLSIQDMIEEELVETIYEEESIVSVEDELTLDEIQEIKSREIMNRAAFRIQDAWRDYRTRQRVKQEEFKKLIVYGMADERKWDYSYETKINEQRETRRSRKTAFDTAFVQAIEDEKSRILRVKSPWLMEDISDHVREWFREFYYTVKDFDRYPEAFEGGTILVIKGETMDPEEFKLKQVEIEAEKQKTPEQKAKEKEQKKAEAAKVKEKARQEKLKKKQELARRKAREKQGKVQFDFKKEPEDRIKAPIAALETSFEEYENDWYFINEMKNPKEDPIMEWITIDKYAEVHQELRPIVDEFMRIEYELLRQALAKDRKKKYKPQKAKKQRKKKGKKGKGKGKKKKGQVNLLEEHTVEDLYKELTELKIIEKYDRCSLDEYIGDLNYKAYEQREQMFDPLHGLHELKNTLRTCILGMGPLNIPKPKSICLAGPPLSGKKYLTYAIASETNSVLFDLSPDKIGPVQDITRLVNLVTQMARVLQPSILFINGAHKPFYKKVPKEEQELTPKKLGKFLFKNFVKPIKKDEKVMLIGTTNEPWNCALGKLKKCYEKILLIPRTDYGNCFITWRHELLGKLGIPRDICVSPLAKVTQGMSTGQIIKCVNDCVGVRRRMRLSRNELTFEELLEYFLQQDPPLFPMSIEVFEKYKKWFLKANKLAKKRNEQVLLAHPPDDTDDGKGKGGKKK